MNRTWPYMLAQVSLLSALSCIYVGCSSARAADGAQPSGSDAASPSTPEKAEPARAGPKEAEGEEKPRSPPVAIVAFTDADVTTNCDRDKAQLRDCVEVVQFLDLEQAWSDGARRLDRATRAQLRAIGRLYAWEWEDLATRWVDEDDIPFEVYQKARVQALPAPHEAWAESARAARPRYSLPDGALWVPESQWLAGAAQSSAAAFPAVVTERPALLPEIPDTVMLRGRFADRLRTGDRDARGQLSDADPRSSGPFFEQMFPFNIAMDEIACWGEDAGDGSGKGCADTTPLVQEAVRPPLWRFQVPDALTGASGTDPKERMVTLLETQRHWRPPEVAVDGTLSELQRIVHDEFQRLYLRIGAEIIRFGAEQVTRTHMRVLTALFAMHTPPGVEQVDVQSALGPNPGGRGQTDAAAVFEQLINVTSYASEASEGMNARALPSDVVRRGLVRLSDLAMPRPEPRLLETVRESVEQSLADAIDPDRCGSQALEDLTPDGIHQWALRCGRLGQEQRVEALALAITLEVCLNRLGESDAPRRSREESRLVLDHLDVAISEQLRAKADLLVSSNELVDASTRLWRSVLALHGMSADVAPQGAGAVDPLSVCSTETGEKALDDPRFGPVELDLLVVAQDGLAEADEVLWSAGPRLPFLIVDDPGAPMPAVDGRTDSAGATVVIPRAPSPELARIVGLPPVVAPDGVRVPQALYRVRWRLWSGWHVLWGVEEPIITLASPPVAAPAATPVAVDERYRVVARTAAICESATLVDPSLVPTLVRAGLLLDGMRPTLVSYSGHNERQARRGARREARQSARATARAQREAPSTPDKGVEAGQSAARDVSERWRGLISKTETASASADGAAEVATDPLDKLGANGSRDKDSPVGPLREETLYLQGLVRAPIAARASPEQRLTLVSFDLAERAGPARAWRLRPSVPYSVTERRVGWRTFTRGAVWSQVFTTADTPYSVDLSPLYRPTARVIQGSDTPRWRRRHVKSFQLDLGLAAMPYSRVDARCDAVYEMQDLASYVAPQCELEDTLTTYANGGALDVGALFSIALVDQPRIAFEVGPTFQMVGIPFYYTLLPSDEVDPVYHWQYSPRAGASVGLRFAPDPGSLVRYGHRYPTWGNERLNGKTLMRRAQGGVRVGGLWNPGLNGAELNLSGDAWAGLALRSERSSLVSLSPYYPSSVLGPYVHVQRGFLISDAIGEHWVLDRRWEVMVGARLQLRLGGKPPELPEVE